MKICFLGDAGSIHIRRWVEYFRNKGDEVSIITFRNYEINNVDVRYIGDKINVKEVGGNINYLKKIRTIKRIIKEINPDIVNAHYLTSYGFIGALVTDRNFYVSTWGTDILVTPNKNFLYKKLTQYVLKRADLVTSDSSYMTKEIERLGCDAEKILTVPMGIEAKNFNSINRAHKNKIFLSMRTLCDNSNIDIILRAFKLVYEEDNEVRLIITNCGINKEATLKLVNELGLEDCVEYLGFVDRDNISKLLKNSSYFISIPTSDSTSVTLLEAMACGCFPIVSDIKANNEWVTNESNGIVIDEIDVDKLHSAMKKVLSDNDLFEKSIPINKNIIETRAIWENNMNEIYVNYYNKRK